MKKLIIKGMDKRYFSGKIVEWYLQNKRDLPWRQTTDPYKIWLSEIILQQTRVSQGLPYYENFVKKYPTVSALAAAPEQQVLRMWQGLGYYTRARNLHKCAKVIAREQHGNFPKSFIELKKLPGIGDYTAAAIASFAYGEKVAVVDGNVYRVLSRIFGIDTPINKPDGKVRFSALANELISDSDPGLFNQAMMEFGATFCTPKTQDCDQCIFRTSCFARNRSMQSNLPVKIKLKESRNRYFTYVVIKKGDSLALRKREKKDVWIGLFDFPLIESKRAEKALAVVKKSDWRGALTDDSLVTISPAYKHVLSHQNIHARFIIIENGAFDPKKVDADTKFYSFKKILDLPKPVLISRFLNDSIFHS